VLLAIVNDINMRGRSFYAQTFAAVRADLFCGWPPVWRAGKLGNKNGVLGKLVSWFLGSFAKLGSCAKDVEASTVRR